MIFAVDHIVFAVTAPDRARMADELLGRGFARIPLDLDFSEIGAASESFATAGGGFGELVYETEPGRAPAVWFDEVPRVIGVGFSSDDFERDVAAWDESEGMWLMDEDKVLSDGSILNIHAAGPHPHLEDFYVFVMDTTELPYADRGALARLESLTFEGERAFEWRQRLAGWLAAEPAANGLRVGDIELLFVDGKQPNVRLSPLFAVPFAADPIPLAAGEIAFIRR